MTNVNQAGDPNAVLLGMAKNVRMILFMVGMILGFEIATRLSAILNHLFP